MPTATRILAIAGSLGILFVIIELVRRRRLKEEYSVLWIVTGVVLLVLSIWYGLLLKITTLIGAVLPSSTLFFFGLTFVMLMLLHFSVRVSLLERRIMTLAQEVALVNAREQPPAEPALPEQTPDTPPVRA